MSEVDCGVCIGGDTGDYCTVSTSKMVKARKPHECDECSKIIQPGEIYECCTSLFDGEWSRMNVCAICSEISIAFSCEGRVIGNMWEDIHDNLFPNMTTGCLAKLKTAAAKEHLVKKCNEWKFGKAAL